MSRRKLVVGNWKMNGMRAHLDEVEAIGKLAAQHPAVEVGLCLPATLIMAGSQLKGAAFIGAQNCHMELSGAYTGSLSAEMLIEAGATWVITGHSERRETRGETNADVAAKSVAAHAAGMKVILCVGETLAVRDAGDADEVVTAQLLASLPEGASADWLAVAYEPIWAIGTGRIPTLEAIQSMHATLRAALASRIGQEQADAMRILYGGSMNGDNAAEIIALPDVDGGLVGGASLSAAKFEPVIAAAD
ncbi:MULTISPECIES: triose-phosphate isomerase [Sphingobium]|jgi:triosephosphate isomerase|uniref:Triosephosphate isomerase n=2 Tax=Sphingobium yanoikuyae TaxID=13690 RepID=K9CPW5_SPHYA|nr:MULTISPECIES: triose-phosphate isomerase [Sphingobium]RSU80186.1 triose-phosphate isomerase [Sphingomonas sp. S-NIH.Pt3_0716]ATI79048.1 triose-phosphate isomerase [Sphingobium yanoikuyae]AYO76262.1 triose-phosphate isomerase [Sphingobium yanoikuyae]EKU73953.1 triose-phosphate isomerase [Sphingobium yanoikuyae ATCC 51230]KEZ20404.1 Triosephosphate isomerase [Sphingobium yanoikuyae]